MADTTELCPQVQPLQHAATFVREGFITLNPAQANVILRECRYDLQRKIDKTHASVLAELMARGLWERKDKIDFVRVDGRLILVNGYHRMTAQIESGKNVEWTIVIHDCATVSDVAEIYHRFDTNVRSRSDHAVLSGSGFAAEVGLQAVWAKALYGAAPIIANGLNAGNVAASAGVFARRIVDDRLTIAREYAPAARTLERLFKKAPDAVRKKVRIRTIFAVALVTTTYQPEVAESFWGGLAADDGLRRGDPRKTLLNDMASRNFHRGIVQQGIASPAIAWNAFWERRNLSTINKIVAGRKFRLNGTPFTVTI